MKTPEMNRHLEPRLQLLSDINKLANKIQAIGNTYGDEISWKQGMLLMCLENHEENPTIGELAEMLGTSHQNTKILLNKLEEKEYITLKRDEVDRRKILVAKTSKVTSFVKKSQESYNNYLDELFKNLSDERIKEGLKLISIMNQNLE